MITIITTISFSILSSFVFATMACETNKRLRKNQPDIEENTYISKPYERTFLTYLFLVVIAIVSGLCGYIISLNAVSWIAIVQLGICYLATLASATIDLKTRTIPNFIPLVLIVVRIFIIIYEFFVSEAALASLISSLIGCSLCALMLIIANKISKGGIGGGDIKLLSGIGFMCGIYVVMSALLLALISCIIISVMLLALKKKTSKDHLPFGPFIYIGFTIMCLFTLY